MGDYKSSLALVRQLSEGKLRRDPEAPRVPGISLEEHLRQTAPRKAPPEEDMGEPGEGKKVVCLPIATPLNTFVDFISAIKAYQA